jgi:hypothetical protein
MIHEGFAWLELTLLAGDGIYPLESVHYNIPPRILLKKIAHVFESHSGFSPRLRLKCGGSKTASIPL